MGSIVEESMKRRSEFATWAVESGGWRIWAITFVTCEGSGRTVIVVSYSGILVSKGIGM